EVVDVALVDGYTRELDAHVVGPTFGDVAARAEQSAERLIVELRLTTAAFDVTAAEVHRDLVRVRQERLARDVVGRTGLAVRTDSRVRIDGLARCQSRSTATDRRGLLRREERVVAVDRGGVEEGAARSDLRVGADVRVHQLRVDVGK